MEKFIIPQSRVIKPFRQGQLDTLCGLYSIINAIRLAAYPQKRFTKFHVSVMMRDALIYLNSRPERLLDSMIDGMSHNRKRSLAKHMIKFVNKVWNLKLELIRPDIIVAENSRPTLVSFIENSLKSGFPVLIEIEGHHHHHTIISGYNSRSYFLYDSDGLTSLQRSLISIDGDREGMRHELVSKGVLALER